MIPRYRKNGKSLHPTFKYKINQNIHKCPSENEIWPIWFLYIILKLKTLKKKEKKWVTSLFELLNYYAI